ncbi:ectonucleotide pyrophosphatase/phosphodiesterase family member 7-like [Dasypus novemcinctus]|uniref:ectonucleotide pyrophosphatase/phosphodiesterase family member 7-like n=1 Tax=Dasypus novemcinctus TaxID=9361 RepID=UPI00265E0EF5|nr:ectonucleotide pyrophosphatase/phosphodiesterase family member 7-like [Dasypus novemcinctus]
MRLGSALLPVLLGCAACHPLPRGAGARPLLLISFDGFRWDYDQDVDTPHLDRLAREGVKAKYLTPPFVTMTSPSHFTTISGRWIEDHGVIHNMMFNTETLWKYSFKATQNKTEWWDNGVLPLWITAQRQGKKVASFHYPGGGAKYAGEAVQRTLVEAYTHPDSNETEWRENIDIVLGWFAQEDFDFVTLYYGEPDNVGHRVGPETEDRRAMIRQIDRTLGYLVDAIERHGLTHRLNVIITSDHGMTTVKKQPNVTEILLANYIKFRDLVKFDIVDYGGFGMLLPKPGQEEALYQALKNAHPHLHVYRKEEFPERFHFAKHERVLPILIYADSGYNLNGRFIIYVNKGDHGFDNALMDMKTIFRAFGPDFKKNHLAEPFDSIHIYPLMCKLLGVTPEPHNGSLAVTQGMLLDPSDQSEPEHRLSYVLIPLFWPRIPPRPFSKPRLLGLAPQLSPAPSSSSRASGNLSRPAFLPSRPFRPRPLSRPGASTPPAGPAKPRRARPLAKRTSSAPPNGT